MEEKYDIFISYRRDGGESTAKMLRDKLDSLGYRVFFDVESLRSGNFNTALYTVIDECRDFILILSPNALDRCSAEDDWVRLEIEHALQKGCNVIPIMLRGFSFPKELPESINEIRYKNGLESNYQFFDAFIEKLRSFLLSNPLSKKRLLLKRFAFGFAALLVIFLICMGSIYVFKSRNEGNGSYPYTNDERNVTGNFIYYLEINLQQMELAAEYIDKSYQACSQYLTHIDTASRSSLLAELNNNRKCLKEIDLESSSMSQELKDSLASSPFSAADAYAVHDYLKTFIDSGIQDIDYIQLMTDEEFLVDIKTKEEILKNYSEILSEELKIMSYNTNELLLPIQNEEVLEEFKYKFLIELYYVPLQPSAWSYDEKILESDSEKCWNTIQKIENRIALLIGDENLQVMQIKQNLIQQLVAEGYTEREAQREVEDMLGKGQLVTEEMLDLEDMKKELEEKLDEAREKFAPSMEDDSGILWGKMLRFLNLSLYDEAVECIDVYREKMRNEDIYAEDYCAAAVRFIKNIGNTGIDYGSMVVGYGAEKEPDMQYEIGDVIIAVNQKPCHNYDEYALIKGNLSEEENMEVVVLRAENGGSKLEQVQLVIPVKSSGVMLLNMTEKNYEEKP